MLDDWSTTETEGPSQAKRQPKCSFQQHHNCQEHYLKSRGRGRHTAEASYSKTAWIAPVGQRFKSHTQAKLLQRAAP
ncbi:hypothetical protein WJX72_000029 [[Myrmecia] bisecta]|uniref:Uncharacterized protein n=1 Tax=[Myrmecia] bisecta TaxID=41462 RepID=A0AAW1Q2L0_9CHLO